MQAVQKSFWSSISRKRSMRISHHAKENRGTELKQGFYRMAWTCHPEQWELQKGQSTLRFLPLFCLRLEFLHGNFFWHSTLIQEGAFFLLFISSKNSHSLFLYSQFNSFILLKPWAGFVQTGHFYFRNTYIFRNIMYSEIFIYIVIVFGV